MTTSNPLTKDDLGKIDLQFFQSLDQDTQTAHFDNLLRLAKIGAEADAKGQGTDDKSSKHSKSQKNKKNKLITEKQINKYDEAYLENLITQDKNTIKQELKALVFSTKTLYDKLNMNSANSSLSPSSDLFGRLQKKPLNDKEIKDSNKNDPENSNQNAEPPRPRKKRDHGYGRTQKFTVTHHEEKKPTCCSDCKKLFDENTKSMAYTAYYQFDFVKGDQGYTLKHTRYMVFKSYCADCDVWTKHTPNSVVTSDGFIIKDNGLIGDVFASVITLWNKKYRMPVKHIKSMCYELYGVELSEGRIVKAIIETGLCCEPVVEQIAEEIAKSDLCYADETRWFEKHKTLWLWCFVTATVCLFMVGSRSKKMTETILYDKYNGWLMSDGYNAYRAYPKRLRCLAHLKRKAIALSQSKHKAAREFGNEILALLKDIFNRVYEARIENIPSLQGEFQQKLAVFKMLCIANHLSEIDKVKELSREFLNDWIAIFRVLEYPRFPLTNNEAERTLRPWVIIRKISLGTQSAHGTKAVALLASVIETCRRKEKDAITTLSETLTKAKSGDESFKFILTNDELKVAA